jgi:predicted ATP-dependent protease
MAISNVLAYPERDRADVARFRALWRDYFNWTAPSDDDLRRLMFDWKRYTTVVRKRAMRLTASRLGRSATFGELAIYCGKVLVKIGEMEDAKAQAAKQAAIEQEQKIKEYMKQKTLADTVKVTKKQLAEAAQEMVKAAQQEAKRIDAMPIVHTETKRRIKEM